MSNLKSAVTITAAALLLKRSPVTIRRWIKHGAPTARLGKEGRGNGSLVVPADLLRWNAGVESVEASEILPQLATALWDVFKRDAAGGLPAHHLIGIEEWRAAAYLVEVFERLAQGLAGSVPDPLPDQIRILISLVEQTARK